MVKGLYDGNSAGKVAVPALSTPTYKAKKKPKTRNREELGSRVDKPQL